MENLLSGKLSSTRSDPPFTLQQLCQKFNYLQGYFEGDAFNSILGLAITSQNYMQAMDLLQKCYGNPQLIVHYKNNDARESVRRK